MDEDIDQVIAGDIRAVKVIIQGKAEHPQKTGRLGQRVPNRADIGDVPDLEILSDEVVVVEMKRVAEGMTVDQCGQDDQGEDSG